MNEKRACLKIQRGLRGIPTQEYDDQIVRSALTATVTATNMEIGVRFERLRTSIRPQVKETA